MLRSHFLPRRLVRFFSPTVFLLFCNPLCINQRDLHRELDWKSELSAAIFCSAQIIWQTFSYSKSLWQHGLTCQDSLFLLNSEWFVRSVEVFSLVHCRCSFLDGLSAQLCSILIVPFGGSIKHGVWSLCSFPVCPDFCHEISYSLVLSVAQPRLQQVSSSSFTSCISRIFSVGTATSFCWLKHSFLIHAPVTRHNGAFFSAGS